MNIYLIGMMGCGKTTIAKALTKQIHMKFIDMDEAIVKIGGVSIQNYFNQYGETSFRILETEVLNDISKNKNQIISTGGGVVLSLENTAIMQKNGIIIYLENTAENCYKRVRDDKQRPLVTSEDKFTQMFATREPIYNKVCTKKIVCVNKEVDEIVSEILFEIVRR